VTGVAEFDTSWDIGDAEISSDGRYRYWLLRSWQVGSTATFVMLNPSRADWRKDDNTIRRCIVFAKRWGCGSMQVGNLYGLRATEPADLWRADDPVGSENDEVLLQMLSVPGPIIVAWGGFAKPDRVREFRRLAEPFADRLMCLGTTKAGAPRHPLYVRGDTPLTPWPSS
jgi:hypothetical protein